MTLLRQRFDVRVLTRDPSRGNANLVDATRAAGADLVLMSAVGACADSPMELFRMKHTAEQLPERSGRLGSSSDSGVGYGVVP